MSRRPRRSDPRPPTEPTRFPPWSYRSKVALVVVGTLAVGSALRMGFGYFGAVSLGITSWVAGVGIVLAVALIVLLILRARRDEKR